MKFTSKTAVLTAITSSLVGLLVVMLPLTAWAADPCDRACLEHHVDTYIDAMIAHYPGRLALARDARYTENGQELRFGDGLWNTTSGRGKYKLYVADTDSGQVGFFGTVFENGTPLLIANAAWYLPTAFLNITRRTVKSTWPTARLFQTSLIHQQPFISRSCSRSGTARSIRSRRY